VIESQVGEEMQNMLITNYLIYIYIYIYIYITTSKQFNRLIRQYALNSGCSNFKFGLETRNSEELHVSSAVFPEK